MPRKSDHPLRVYAPGERRNNRTCIIKGRMPDGTPFEQRTKISDPVEARRIADDCYREAEERLERKRRSPARPETFGQLIEYYLRAHPHIRKQDRQGLAKLAKAKLQSIDGVRLGEVTLEALTPSLAQEATLAVWGHTTGANMNRSGIVPFSAVVHFGEANRWMPWLRVEHFPEVRRVTPRLEGGEDDVQRILEIVRTAPRPKSGQVRADHPYRYLLVLFLFRQGFRISETLKLEWDQIDLVRGRLKLVRVDKGKEVKNTLPIHPDVYEALAALPEGEAERCAAARKNRVFPWSERHNVYRWLNPIVDEVLRFRPHQARVEFASQLGEADQPAVKIKDCGTWTDARSVERYIRTSDDERAATIELVGRRKPRRKAENPAAAEATAEGIVGKP